MNDFRNYLNDLEVQTVSETGAARVTVSKARSIEIELDTECPSYINEKELAKDVENAVKDARTEHSRAIREFKDNARNTSEKNQSLSPNPAQKKRREQYLDEISEIECTTKSPRGLVTVNTYGDGDIILRITPHTLNRVGFDLQGLAREMASTIESGIKERSKRVKIAHRNAYGQI